MATYVYPLSTARQYEIAPLVAQLQAAQPAITNVSGSPDAGTITITTSRDLTAAEQSAVGSIVSAYDGRQRGRRLLDRIIQDTDALSDSALDAAWADLTAQPGGGRPRVALSAGPNGPAINVFRFLQSSVPLDSGRVRMARARILAMYCQDNPTYLVNPPFAPGVNVPGDEPVG